MFLTKGDYSWAIARREDLLSYASRFRKRNPDLLKSLPVKIHCGSKLYYSNTKVFKTQFILKLRTSYLPHIRLKISLWKFDQVQLQTVTCGRTDHVKSLEAWRVRIVPLRINIRFIFFYIHVA